MSLLYVTSDQIGIETGGGAVTNAELDALQTFGDVDLLNKRLEGSPFDVDDWCISKQPYKDYNLAHFYAGTYTKFIEYLQSKGTKITYTSSAHSIEDSKAEYELYGMDYTKLYPHLSNPNLRERYLKGYVDADICIAPSQYSKSVVESYGCKHVEVIPHGCRIPEEVKPIPDRFQALFLSQPGPDKGLIYLIKAWAQLNFKDGHLTIAGRGTENVIGLVRQYGKGSIFVEGEAKSTRVSYNSCSIVCVPSATEGFGLSVLEGMSYGRPVVCSEGAGAVDLVEHEVTGLKVPKKNPGALAEAINYYKKNPDKVEKHGKAAREKAKNYTWDRVKAMYCQVWKRLIK